MKLRFSRGGQSSSLPVIDSSTDLGQQLVFFCYHGTDLATGKHGSPVSSYSGSTSARYDSYKGRVLESHSTTNGGFFWEGSNQVQRVYGGREFTLVIDCELDSMDSYGSLIGTPASTTAWSSPYFGFSLHRLSSGVTARCAWRTGSGSYASVTSGANYLVIDGTRHTYAVSMRYGVVRFYRDGVYHSGGSSTSADIYQSINNVYLLSRNTTASAEGTNGRVYSAGIWRKELLDAEIASLYRNPYQMLKERLSPVLIQAGSSSSLLLPNLTTATTTVRNATIVAGALMLLPSIVSATATVRDAEIRSVTLILPSLVTASQTVNSPVISSIITLQPSQVSATALVRNINLIYQQFIQPSIVSATGLVRNLEILSGNFLSPSSVSATALVYSVNTTSGAVTILPILVSASAVVRSIFLDDGSVLPEYFYSNDTMVDYFRTQTGVDSYNFNELAIAYYKQVASSSEEQFNDLNKAAQDVAGFVGLAPTDWRNF